MSCNRRNFMKVTSASIVGLGLAQLGFDLKPAFAYAAKLKIEGAKEVITVCPFCAVSCHIVAYVKKGKLVGTEGDPDHPVNEGALCAKGAALLSMARSEHRLKKPKYRAPYSTKWEEKSWAWTLTEIAKRIKKTRDSRLILKNKKGNTVNRLEAMFLLGTSHADNEECALAHQAMRGLGVVHMDHQARI